MQTYQAIYVMWIRELRRFARSKSRTIGSLAQPLFFLLAFGYGFGSLFAKAGGGDYINFLTPGIVGMTIIFTSIFNGVQVIWDRQFGFLKETLVAPVPRWAIMLGRTLGGATVATLQALILIAATVLIGFHPQSWWALPPAVGVMFLMGMLFSALGLAIGSRMRDFQGFQLVMNFLVMPLFFLSGALFPLANVPAAMLWVARFDPLSYGVEALRILLIDTSQTVSTFFGIWTDLSILIVFLIAFMAAGTWSFSKIQA